MVSNCQVCKNSEDVKIILRQCGHIVCLPCILDHLKHKIILEGEPRIKCPDHECLQVIHQNDINAVLDEKEAALEYYMPIENRRYLQFKQNKHSIYKALPTDEIKRCPLCRAVYMKEPGCHYVVCANSACNLAFCWCCEKPVDRAVAHYTTNKCRLGYLDYERLLNVLRYILDVNVLMLWAFLPFVYFLAYLYIPIAIFFAVPFSIVYEIWADARVSGTYWIAIIPIIMKTIVHLGLGLIITMPISLGSVMTAMFVTGIYGIFCLLKMVPFLCTGDRIGSLLCITRWLGRLFRIGPYGQLLDEARKGQNAAIQKLEDQNDDFANAETSSIHPVTEKEKESDKKTTESKK